MVLPGHIMIARSLTVETLWKSLVVFMRLRVLKWLWTVLFSRQTHPFLIKSGQNLLGHTRKEIARGTQATQLRQSAEWGMRLFQATYPRMKDPVTIECLECRLIIRLYVYIFNLRSRFVKLNQIENVYMGPLRRDANGFVVSLT